ncbi:lysosomal proton-coupled steroid conjugate and bile acid symporter SLC46A3-like isoform X1 [Battus philenor]|uniref:lysosomal proton-coupled steroid conjugate and bile acid symporter SLC46A3-like isoform X1 n=2 Tax=Battus philenor TaxID=42288 RepID=UPI0035CF39D7
MVEGTVDVLELEKLRPINDSNKGSCDNTHTPQNESSQKWNIILEPALAGAMMAINLGQTSLQNFYLKTACTVDLGYSFEVCERGVGEEFRTAEAASQMVVSGVNISRSFVGCLLSTIVLLFVGPWSDCSGRRKPLLMTPLIGMSVMTTGVLLLLTFPGASTVQVLYVVQIPISLGGNFGLLLAASFSHVGDICHASGRDITRTMGSHRAAIQIAHVLGAVCGPLLYRYLGFYGVFPLVLLLQLASLLYVILVIKDVNVNDENKVSVFNWRLPLNAFQCLFRRRDGYKRTIILLMLIVALGDRMLLSAEVLLAYMFYRYKFQWDDVMFGSFIAYRNIVSFIGTLLILTVLKKRLRLSDEMVGVLSCTSYILATSGLVAASSTLVVFLLPLVGIIAQGSQVVQRPILNKQILPTEQGRIYSVLGALESATQTLSSPLYSLLYTKTVSTMPDAWLAPGIILVVFQLLSYAITKRLGIKTARDIEMNASATLDKSKDLSNSKEEANDSNVVGNSVTNKI